MPAIRVSLVTVGCARNDVDSEELGGRLAADGFQLVDDQSDADVVVVNTCGFVEAARKDSVDALLESVEPGRHVVAVGCMAERYGAELSDAMPEVDAVLGFDSYPDIAARLRDILDGHAPAPHTPRDRRLLLPITPSERPAAAVDVVLPGHGWVPRRRLDDGPVASLKLASGCDRRCSFCAIPSFRGSFVSRPPQEVLAEARWLADSGARELVLVSENSTSYGKDIGDLRLLEALLPELAAVPGIERVRVSYLQPAEMRPGLIDVIAGTPGVAAYADLSFQHASPGVLRRMRRFGGTDEFLALIGALRERAPGIGIRSNFIVGFPGETDRDLEELEGFLVAARLDAMGVFGYSAEEGTEAASYDDALPGDEVRRRASRLSDLVDELTVQRAEERIGERVRVLVIGREDGTCVGPAEHQGPEDATTRLPGVDAEPGSVVEATVVDVDGFDLVAAP